eukprot:TRINITY_DN14281_c1_g1_i2.p1 TRINITY_DN14281_c1_g1~~TRINITY_DN14281_c1_g1_i2.p1  ORF type:complete len:366 (+),score=83.74 TRINITY_DN14281_c1_g1_i2:86-1183(+)
MGQGVTRELCCQSKGSARHHPVDATLSGTSSSSRQFTAHRGEAQDTDDGAAREHDPELQRAREQIEALQAELQRTQLQLSELQEKQPACAALPEPSTGERKQAGSSSATSDLPASGRRPRHVSFNLAGGRDDDSATDDREDLRSGAPMDVTASRSIPMAMTTSEWYAAPESAVLPARGGAASSSSSSSFRQRAGGPAASRAGASASDDETTVGCDLADEFDSCEDHADDQASQGAFHRSEMAKTTSEWYASPDSGEDTKRASLTDWYLEDGPQSRKQSMRGPDTITYSMTERAAPAAVAEAQKAGTGRHNMLPSMPKAAGRQLVSASSDEELTGHEETSEESFRSALPVSVESKAEHLLLMQTAR